MTGLPHHIQVRQPFYLNSSGLQDEHVPVVKFIVRSPGNFPVIAVRVRKIAMEAAPENILGFLDDPGSRVPRQFNDFNYLLLRFCIIGKRNSRRRWAEDSLR